MCVSECNTSPFATGGLSLQVVGRHRVTTYVSTGTQSAFVVTEKQATKHKLEMLMKKNRKDTGSNEPIGIVISRGDRTEPTPVFSAYIWGPVPEAVVESATRAA
jgi:hypothetical protein